MCKKDIIYSSVSKGKVQGGGQGPTNIFYKTCPWASGMQKSLAQKDEVVVPCHRWYKCCRNYFAPFSGNK